MLDLGKNDYQTIRLLRKRGSRRDEVLNAINIPEGRRKQLVDIESELALLNRSRKSLEFSIVKKWTSPRIRSVSSNRMNKSDEIDVTSCKSVSPMTRFNKQKVLNFYGEIKGVKIGDWWSSRIECSDIGVHRPAFASIHAGPDGAYSISLTGCYENNDKGVNFVYSGSACRDFRSSSKDSKKRLSITAPPKNQTNNGYNASLMRNLETGNPVRVIRGYKLNSKFAPVRGYRYDGLYKVEKFWTCKTASGLVVFKFLLTRCQNQLPAPWELEFDQPKNQIHSSMKQSPLVLDKTTATDVPVNQYQAMSSPDECMNDDSIRQNKTNESYAHDNKENSTLNIADKLLLLDSFTDGSILSSADDSLPRINKRKLPRKSKTKQNFKKHCEHSVQNIWKKNAETSSKAKDEPPSDSFRGFSPECYPRKMILLGFLIHDLQSKLQTANQTL